MASQPANPVASRPRGRYCTVYIYMDDSIYPVANEPFKTSWCCLIKTRWDFIFYVWQSPAVSSAWMRQVLGVERMKITSWVCKNALSCPIEKFIFYFPLIALNLIFLTKLCVLLYWIKVHSWEYHKKSWWKQQGLIKNSVFVCEQCF